MLSGRLLSSSYYEHSAEHSINQFIAYTINYCLKHFSTYGCNDSSLIHDLKLRYGYFERFLITRRQLDIKLIKQTIDRDLVPNIRHYYNYVLDVSLAIVEETAIELEKSGTDVEASSFVINMANVFEDYIRALLNSSYALSEHGISVIDGNSKESQFQLFNDNKTFLIKPDVVLKSKEHTQLILEVKYKPKFSEADRYQVISHAYSTSCKKAVLVKPKFHDNEKPGLKYVGNVGPDNLELYEYITDLSDEDYLEMEKRFNKDIFNLLKVE